VLALLAALAVATEPTSTPPGSALAALVSVDPYHSLEVLYDQGRMQEGLTQVSRLRQAAPRDPELIWHEIRFRFEIAEVVPRTDRSFDKEAWYQEMVDLANEGLGLAPGHGHLLFARGIAVGRLGTTRGVLASLGSARQMEADWQAAARSGHRYRALHDQEILPCDAYLTLAMFYRLVPDWWIVETVAGTRGDLQKSVDYAQQADRCSPNRMLTLKELGASQLCLGQSRGDDALVQAGLGSLRRAATLPVGSQATDRVDLAHVRLLLADPSLACGYSRDGQQERDREALGQ